MRRTVTPRDQGVSLIEMVIAVLVLSIGIVAAFQSLGQSRAVIGGELPRLLAQTVALNRAEELKLLGLPAARSLPNRVRMGPFEWDIAITEAATEAGFVETTVRATSPGQPGAMFVVYIIPREP